MEPPPAIDHGRSSVDAGIRAADFQLFWEVAARHGVEREALLSELALDPAAYHQPQSVLPFQLTNRLFAAMSARLPRGSFGLDLAAQTGALKMAGPLSIAMQNASTLQQASEFYAGFIRTYCSPFEIGIAADEASAKVSIDIDVPNHGNAPNIQGIEHFLLFLARLTAERPGQGVRPREIWFAHAPVSERQVYARYFPCAVRFEQPVNAIRFDAADFIRPRPDGNEELFELAGYYLRHAYRPCSRGLLPDLRAFVREALSSDRCTPTDAARRMGLMPRTLQRRLRYEGTSFEVVKDEIRRDFALRYLAQDLSLTEVAARLGYSEASVLTRSCHRWFSGPPRQVRSQLKATRQVAASR